MTIWSHVKRGEKVHGEEGVFIVVTKLNRLSTRRPLIALAVVTALAVLASAPALAATAKPAVKIGTAGGKKVVVDAKGRTLYVLTPETATRLLCTSSCLPSWPALRTTKTAKLVAGSGVKGKLGRLRRSGGSYQVTLRGLPLYTFAGDARAGVATGDGLRSFGGTWHVVRPSG